MGLREWIRKRNSQRPGQERPTAHLDDAGDPPPYSTTAQTELAIPAELIEYLEGFASTYRGRTGRQWELYMSILPSNDQGPHSKGPKWQGILSVGSKDLPRLMKRGLHISEANVLKDKSHFLPDVHVPDHAKSLGLRCCRAYVLSDLGRHPQWKAKMTVYGRSVRELSGLRVGDLSVRNVAAAAGFNANDLAALVTAVREGAKYRHLDVGLVEAVAAAELAKGRNFKESVKATRNKLHQVAGAYLPDRPDYAAWFKLISQATNDVERQAAYRQVMGNHASTRERLAFLDSFYSTILGDLPPIHSILDLACGLNPLAASWMPLAADAPYFACDIYQDQIDFLNRIFQLMGQQGQAVIGNLLQAAPSHAADVALLLKTIPCLEQLDKGIGPRLLAQINAPVIVISFPARSLGGRGKGMVQNYADHFAALVAGQSWKITRFDFPTEMIFRVMR